MTEDQVNRQFQQITQPRSTRLAGQVVAWIVVAGVLACVVLGVIALARAVL